MEIIIEFVIGFVIELVLAVVGEVLVELGFHKVSDKLSDRAWTRVLTGVGYAVFGIGLGALSLLILPKVAFENQMIPVMYFIVSPIVAGFALCVVNWIIHRGIDEVPIFQWRKFLYGAIFVLAFSSMRAIFG